MLMCEDNDVTLIANLVDDRITAEVIDEIIHEESNSTKKMYRRLVSAYYSKTSTPDNNAFRAGFDKALEIVVGCSLNGLAEIILRENKKRP